MIRGFRSKALRRYFEEQDRAKFSVVNFRRLDRILRSLNQASRPEDMNVPGWRFHFLRGSMLGRYAVNVSGNWRLTFAWDDGDAVDVDLEDYH